MEKEQPAGGHKPAAPARTLNERMQQMSLGDGAPETPESTVFRSLPQAVQRRLLLDYPRVLATAMHQYSSGADCEAILLQLFDSSSEMLTVPNTQGDNPMASALVRHQDERAERLVELADRRNPAALDRRSQWGESLLMLSTSSSSSAASVMQRLLTREPTQLHRLYDNDGRNFLHHCTLEDSMAALDAALQLTRQLIQEGRLALAQVSAAIHMNDRFGNTPMHIMAAGNRADMISRLLEFGKDAGIHINLDERQHTGKRWTPLMAAVGANAVEAAIILIDCGADATDERDTDGQSAENMAAASGSEAMRRLFEHEAAAVEPPVEGAASLETPGPSWMTTGESADSGAVDSGLASFVDTESAAVKRVSAAANGLSDAEIKAIKRGLQSAGKEAAFVRAFQASHSVIASLAGMSEKPIEALVSQLAHDSQCRRLVRDALKQIGEPQLLDS